MMKRSIFFLAAILLIPAVLAASCGRADRGNYPDYKNKAVTGYVAEADGASLSVSVDFEMEYDTYKAVIGYARTLGGISGDEGDGTARPGGDEDPTPFVIQLPEIPIAGSHRPGDAWNTSRMTKQYSDAGISVRKTIELPPDELDDGYSEKETVTLRLPEELAGKHQKGEYVAVIFDDGGRIDSVETIETSILQLFKLLALSGG